MRYLVFGMAAVAAALLPTSVSADSYEDTMKGLYFDLRAGGSFLSDADNEGFATGGITIESEFDTGFVVEGAVGWEHQSGFRGELALGYQQYDVDTLSTLGSSVPGDGDVGALTFMLNGYYAFNLDKFRPYVGVGVGGAHVSADISALGFQAVDDSDTVFAYQGIVGLEYRLSDSVSLGARYAYFATQDPTFFDTAGFEFDSEVQSHNVWELQRSPEVIPDPLIERVEDECEQVAVCVDDYEFAGVAGDQRLRCREPTMLRFSIRFSSGIREVEVRPR